ncbi:adenosylcobinamide-phosphate synthase [Mobilisporobacter senegalensis]|uniref:Cobalamin biosynthesis protein CobD n=1 Tax=Mobilisporobacter senegalensis TaxID=1329262 RepID=A0A3N1XYE4_9FIRM|nr:adenosylcobinamide-phosphate synthase CbiB [Mobilisporobacter senegalensis]ROR31636.1 adenosylcobinamide-phosphate synthase [Mobilisporobacter senegalensis]
MWHSIISVAIGFGLDFIFGDPEGFWHPIRLIGKIINTTESILRNIFPKTKYGELIAGIFLVIIVTGISTMLPFLILTLIFQWNLYIGILVQSIMCYQLIATKSLKVESMKVYQALSKKDLNGARYAVSRIVGRDTEALSAQGIIRATVETIAENTSDGSIAPLFYMVIGGPVLGFFYKSVNTMDSMVGYKNDKYLYFGRAAAKLDDILNFIPARISAFLMIISTKIMNLNLKNAIKIYLRDRFHHSSPNSAHTEAVMAGALDITLGGDAYYFGKLHPKQTIGDNNREIQCEDIKKANHLLYITAIAGFLIFTGIKIMIILSTFLERN